MITKVISVACTLVFITSIQAATSFVYNGSSQSLAPSAGDSYQEVAGGITATTTAWWANVNDAGSTVTGTSNDFGAAWLGIYAGAGMGVCNPNEQPSCASPQHQIDNYNGLDFTLFSFNAAVSLNDVAVASFGNPTGSGSDNVDLSYALLTQAQYNSLTSGTLQFSNVAFTALTSSMLASDTYSLSGTGQYLLIGTSVTANYDNGTPSAFKIQDLQVTATSNGQQGSVPEPASFVLIGSGLLAGAALARRRSRKA